MVGSLLCVGFNMVNKIFAGHYPEKYYFQNSTKNETAPSDATIWAVSGSMMLGRVAVGRTVSPVPTGMYRKVPDNT